MTSSSSPHEPDASFPAERDSSWWKSFREALLDGDLPSDETETITDLEGRVADVRKVVDDAVSRWFSEGPGRGLESRLDRIEERLSILVENARDVTSEDQTTD